MTDDCLRISRTATLHLHGPIAEVFELFEPLGEAKWADGWHPSIVYPPSGIPEKGMVFTTPSPGEPDTVWILSAYDNEQCTLEYHKVSPGLQATRIMIRCVQSAERETRADVSYVITALSENGADAAAKMTDAHYGHWLTQWEVAINYYLRERRALKHHDDTATTGSSR